MSRPVADFFSPYTQDSGSESSWVNQMVETFYKRPTPPSIQPISDRYKAVSQDAITRNKVLSAALEHHLSPLMNPHDPKFIEMNVSRYKLIQKQEDQTQAFVTRNALRFIFSNSGNCAPRAHYAGHVIAQALPESAIVSAVSNPKKDHHIIQFSVKKDEWFVYDPHTNPDSVFDFKAYTQNILPNYPDQGQAFAPLKVRITKQMADSFFSEADTRIQNLVKDFFSPVHSVQQLKADPALVLSVQLHAGNQNLDALLANAVTDMNALVNEVKR